jgi:hypothetical protein
MFGIRVLGCWWGISKGYSYHKEAYLFDYENLVKGDFRYLPLLDIHLLLRPFKRGHDSDQL